MGPSTGSLQHSQEENSLSTPPQRTPLTPRSPRRPYTLLSPPSTEPPFEAGFRGPLPEGSLVVLRGFVDVEGYRAASALIGLFGRVYRRITDDVGASEDDPLYCVDFGTRGTATAWREELTAVVPQHPKALAARSTCSPASPRTGDRSL